MDVQQLKYYLELYSISLKLSFSFIPTSKTVVIAGGREARIYTKNLKANFSLNLRDPETLASYAPDNDIEFK